MAKVAEVNPTHYFYTLHHPINRKSAIWQISLMNKAKESLGELSLEARSGKTVTAAWQKESPSTKMAKISSDSKKKTQRKETFGQSVERTFRGVGADLEEFFTGRRTVDKD